MTTTVSPTRSSRRTRAERADFYDHLVQTSLRLFTAGGYEALTMRKLAAEVGVPPMSLYRYFPTKASLVRHLWDHILDLAYERSMRDVRARQAPIDKLRRFMDGYLQYWLDHRAHYWVVFAIRDELSTRVEGENAYVFGPNPQRFLGKLEELFDACLPRAGLTPEVRRLVLESLLCKAQGYLLGTIGMASLRWSDVQGLKALMLDDVAGQIQRLADPAPQAAATPSVREKGLVPR